MAYQVLIADDYRMIRQMFEEMLKNAGDRYALAGTAENAEQAVAFCRSYPVDLVIMDVVMGTGRDGIDAAAAIRESAQEPPESRASGIRNCRMRRCWMSSNGRCAANRFTLHRCRRCGSATPSAPN